MTPQEALVAIAHERDIDTLIAQPEMLRGHLMDYCRGGNRREFNLLVAACQSRVPQGLRLPASSVLQGDRIADLTRRMVDDHGMADEHARWAIGTWALALSVSTAAVSDLRPSDPVRRQGPERVPDPANMADPKPSATPPRAPATRRDIFLGIGGTAVIASGLTYLVSRGQTAAVPATPTWTTPIPVSAKAPVTLAPTATAVPPTATRVPPIAPPSGPRRLIVDASGSGDYKTFASAILSAKTGEIIVLRPGTYKETLTISKDVRIVGEGGRSMVIVEGAPDAHVFNFTSGSAALTGLTIRHTRGPGGRDLGAIDVTGGTPMIEDCDLTSSASVVSIHGARANPTFLNCTMRDSFGPGLLVFDQGQGIIEKCVISGNTNQGVVIRTGGNPVARDCEIRDGKAQGVSVFDQGQGTIQKCVISGNGAHGVVIAKGGNLTVRDCEIRDGESTGLLVFNLGQGTIEKCVISGNTLSGVEICKGGNLTVRDCQIRGNRHEAV